MCGRVIAVLLSLLSLSFDAFSQCSWTPRFSGQFRTTALDVSVDGPFVWLATGYGIQLFEQGGIVDSIAIPESTRVVRADGTGIAYVGSGSKIYVVRRDGRALSIVRSVQASGVVNDIEISSYLFVATSNGIDHFDRIDPLSPVKTSAFLATSAPNVTSLVIHNNTLYAADGDNTLETFTIAIPSLPQNTGSIETVRATAVHTTAEGLVLASDAFGLNTDLFSGTTRLMRMPFGATSFAASPQGHFVAGPDRTLHAIDISIPTRVAELYEHRLAPTGGTDNVIHDIERSGNTLYVAAGDIGLVVYDVSSIARPFPLANYTSGATNAVRVAGDKAWFSDATGKITEQKIVASGLSLSDERNWSAGAGSIVRDVRDNNLLTTSGATATIWSLSTNPPASAAPITFADAITAAAIRGGGMVALLANGTVWTTTTTSLTPTQLNVPAIALLARSGSAIALAEVNETTRKTILHYYANGDLAAEPRRFTIDGAVVGSIALDANRAALFTFTGINVIDLASGNVTVIPDSNKIIPQQLALLGGDLLALDTTRLIVYDDARTLVRTHRLPADAVAIDGASTTAVLATVEGTAAMSFLAALPEAVIPYASTFYTKIAATDTRAFLFGSNGIDGFATSIGDTPRFLAKIAAGGVIDLAATSNKLFTLSGNGTVTAYSTAGAALAQITLNEGEDAQPLNLFGAGNAVWVSLSKGCSSGACEKKTLVLDPSTLAVTATLTGGIDDLFATSTRAYALADLPDEARVFDISDPLHPSQLASAARPASARSIAAGSGQVYILGDKVYRFTESLTANGESLTAAAPNDATRIRVSGECAIITGRGDSAEIYSLPAFASAPSSESPSAIRSFAVQPGRLLFLTGHSLELWSTTPAPSPAKRRSVGPAAGRP